MSLHRQLVTGQLITRVLSHSQLVTSVHKQNFPSVTFAFVYFIFGDTGSKVPLRCVNDIFLLLTLRQQITLRRILGQKVRSTRHNTIKHDCQLVTQLQCDELTMYIPGAVPDV